MQRALACYTAPVLLRRTPAKRVAPVRAIGWLSLTAIAVNNTVGAGIFTLPAIIAELLGPAAPLAYLIAGFAVLVIALCFAEAGSFFEHSGGPYVYAREAFGRLAAFETGWLMVVARVSGVAAITSIMTDYLGYFLPSAARGPGRAVAATLAIGALSFISYLGVRQGVLAINVITVAKLAPLLVLCAAGVFFISLPRLAIPHLPPLDPLQRASLLLIFAFGGFEAASIPASEVKDARGAVPRASIASVIAVLVLYLAIHLIAQGTLPDLACSRTPLASAAGTFLGPFGSALIAAGAVLSTLGASSTIIFTTPRVIYALAEDGQFPRALAWLHPRYRTPSLAVIGFAVCAWILAVTGTFTQLAGLTTSSRLVYYGATGLAVPVLRRKLGPSPRAFTLPGGWTIPLLSAGVCLWLIAGMSSGQLIALLVAALLGGAVYGLQEGLQGPAKR
jgi:APA family basic amino acid/polyamine antiporter